MSQPLPTAVIDELVALRSSAKLAAETFSEAIKTQAEEHGISKGALRKFICAKEKDDLASLDSEATEILNLVEAK